MTGSPASEAPVTGPAGLPPAIRRLLDSTALTTVLTRAGRGRLDVTTVQVLAGRNDNIAARTVDGEGVFVKQFERPPDGRSATSAAQAHTLAFERYRATRPDRLAGLRAPELLAAGAPEDGGALLAYELLTGVRTFADLADEGDLTTDHLAAAGAALAALHRAPVTADVPTARHRFPPSAAFTAIGRHSWSVASAAELEAWALLQSDAELQVAVARLRDREDQGRQVPVHGDLRLDQLLQSDTGVHVTDFEDFRRGDPARDLGSLLGELAYRAILAIIKDRDGSFSMDVEFTHEEIVDRGARELDAALPLMRALWAGYRTAPAPPGPGPDGPDDPDPDPELAERSAAWLGWHMFDRLLASSKDRNRLLSVHRAAAGIGRAVLLDPARHLPAFGWDA